MIRNAVLHLLNEQPLLADLLRLPEAGDSGLLCTNVRMMNGSRPVFIDDPRSTFFFPYRQMRFVEIPVAAMAAADAPRAVAGPSEAGPPGEVAAPAVASMAAAAGIAVPNGARSEADVDEADVDEPDADLELDEGFLRRVREL